MRSCHAILSTFESLNIALDGVQYLEWPREVVSFDLDCRTDPSLQHLCRVVSSIWSYKDQRRQQMTYG